MKRLLERLYLPLSGLLLLLFFVNSSVSAAIFEGGDVVKGEQLFKANCAACHKVSAEPLVGPGLAGVWDRWADKDALLVKWIQNPKAAAESGDPYIKDLVDKYVGKFGWMANQTVSEAEIKDILAYVKTGGGGAKSAPKEPNNKCLTLEEVQAAAAGKKSGDGLIWLIIIGLVLAIIAISAINISRSLKNAVNDRDGLPSEGNKTFWQVVKSWLWNNKKLVSVIGVLLICYFTVVSYNVLMDIGVYEGYNPEQPIWFSHNVHACQNEIDCQYCHSSAADSKHAGIPSANVCMNCHKGIKEGTKTGTVEIAKIYEAIGFDPTTFTYKENYQEKPIVWNKVHNLPDHVYFNHSQHVTVGKIDCKQCHGPVQMFTTGRQATIEEINAQEDVTGLIKLTKPTLTMGWCIECHNKANIDLTSSGYYEEMHNRFKTSEVGQRTLRSILEDGEVTVREMGGWECGKCHY
ncbi:MAG: c-type cytochrome [Crocinitomicaceae bacterium]|nr:c-type cytochrome [Crocinitomicaceae bacterium]